MRDDLFLDSPRQYAAIRTVADRGIGFDLIMGRPDSGAAPADYVTTVADQLPAGAVESLEGVNEWDLFGGDDWVAEMTDWQRGLYAAAKADAATGDLPVLAPSLAFRQNYASVGDLSAYADLANGHMYPGGYLPSNEITRITQALRTMTPNAPLITTEAGYHNALNADNGHRAVPEDVAGVYLPRLLLEHVRRGEKRMYSYELIDEFDDPDLTDPEAHFGLLHRDLTPKPAYTAMKRLLALLADPGPDLTPGSLAVAADGLPSDARYVLTQKRDGPFVLLLWREVSIYDPVAQQPVAVTPSDVTLRLADPAGLTVYRPSEATGAGECEHRHLAAVAARRRGHRDRHRPGAPGPGAGADRCRGQPRQRPRHGDVGPAADLGGGDRLRGAPQPGRDSPAAARRRPVVHRHRPGQRVVVLLHGADPDRRRLVRHGGFTHGGAGDRADHTASSPDQGRPPEGEGLLGRRVAAWQRR